MLQTNSQIQNQNPFHDKLHAKALEVAHRYRGCVSEVIDILQQLDAHRTYLTYDCTSLYQYAVKYLGLSEDQALNFINVSRRSAELPRLKAQIESGSITLSKARKICSILTADNQDHWLELAAKLPLKKLEQEVARAHPKQAVTERTTYVTGERLKLELGISQQCLEKLKRVQDLVSQSSQNAVDFEGTLEAALEFYLLKRDPVKKAEASRTRQQKKTSAPASKSASGEKSASRAEQSVVRALPVAAKQNVPRQVYLTVPRRKDFPASTVHELNLRDQRRCTHHDRSGNRCENTRWLDVHHLIPVWLGGDDTLGNLTTLCKAHHQSHHENSGL